LERNQLTNRKDIDSNFRDTVDSHRLKPDGRSQPSNANIAETHNDFITVRQWRVYTKLRIIFSSIKPLCDCPQVQVEAYSSDGVYLMAMDKYGHVGARRCCGQSMGNFFN
jgi:hypothetical protein